MSKAPPASAFQSMGRGLSEGEAARRLQRDGPNELPVSRPRGVLRLAFEVASEPMLLLLVACGVIYMVFGDAQEALMLLGFVFVVMGISFFQQRRSERALDALRNLSSPKALSFEERRHAASLRANWWRVTSCYWSKATACLLTWISSRRPTWRSTNRC